MKIVTLSVSFVTDDNDDCDWLAHEIVANVGDSTINHLLVDVVNETPFNPDNT